MSTCMQLKFVDQFKTETYVYLYADAEIDRIISCLKTAWETLPSSFITEFLRTHCEADWSYFNSEVCFEKHCDPNMIITFDSSDEDKDPIIEFEKDVTAMVSKNLSEITDDEFEED